MRVYLVQHGEAASKDVDPDRPLTDRGRTDVENAATLLKRHNATPGIIYHSGKTRAAQTAEILAKALSPPAGVKQRDGLSPNDPPDNMKKELEKAETDVLVVGHLPHLAKLASLLLLSRERPELVAFRQGGVLCLDQTQGGEWQVAWMVVPQLLQ